MTRGDKEVETAADKLGSIVRDAQESGGVDRPKPAGRGGTNPLAVVGAALAAGYLLAKAIDWRGHAHPRL
jgi:hypothetical protein